MESGAKRSEARPTPIISVLIPAYDYAPGVVRIVQPLLREGRDDVEILVHDDSTDDLVERAVAVLESAHSCLQYKRNSPQRGAVHNWNHLLACARGRYVLLVHHDDLPLSERFGSELIAELECRAWPDALILTCLTHDVVRNHLKAGVCNGLRLLIARRWPMYLWRRNVIGPPAALVIRRDLFGGFDPNLKWLVDVDAYYRFLAGGLRRLAVSPLVVVSCTGLSGAITTGIKDKKSLTDAELAYCSGKFPRRAWSVLKGSTLGGRLVRSLEWSLWVLLKAISALCVTLRRPRVSVTEVRQRIADPADVAEPLDRASCLAHDLSRSARANTTLK